jgi:hypothetical protein
MRSALVLTGETDTAMLAAAPEDIQPDVVLPRIDDLLAAHDDRRSA